MNDPFQKALDALNSALEADSAAIKKLFHMTVPCNKDLAGHQTAQVRGDGDHCFVGPLGLVNGIVEAMTGRRIAAVYESGDIVRFREYVPPCVATSKAEPITGKIPRDDMQPIGMSDETARDIWVRLHETANDRSRIINPLSTAEKDLYGILTSLLTARAQLHAEIGPIDPDSKS